MKHKGTPKHIHKFLQVNTLNHTVWRCQFPDCAFVVYPTQANAYVLGRKSICWNCGNTFVMDHNNMKEDFPSCGSCDSTILEIHQELVTKGVNNESLDEYIARKEKEALENKNEQIKETNCDACNGWGKVYSCYGEMYCDTCRNKIYKIAGEDEHKHTQEEYQLMLRKVVTIKPLSDYSIYEPTEESESIITPIIEPIIEPTKPIDIMSGTFNSADMLTELREQLKNNPNAFSPNSIDKPTE